MAGCEEVLGQSTASGRSQQTETDRIESVSGGDLAKLQEVPMDEILLNPDAICGVGHRLSPPLLPEPLEDQEERVFAMLGIVGTILNLLVIIFIYIYTTI